MAETHALLCVNGNQDDVPAGQGGQGAWAKNSVAA